MEYNRERELRGEHNKSWREVKRFVDLRSLGGFEGMNFEQQRDSYNVDRFNRNPAKIEREVSNEEPNES